MVARTPPPSKEKKMAVAPLNPVLIRETVRKVDRCMARLQELQYTVTGGSKVISGVTLSPRSTRGYLRTSLICKQESLRIKNATPRKSPVGKFPTNTEGEWKRMSLPAMLLGETLKEILQSSQFARDIVESVSSQNPKLDDPKTPLTQQRKQRPQLEGTELKARRKKEKQKKLQTIRSESKSPPTLQRARSRINFKVVSPPSKREAADKEKTRHLANRVSPKNRPWAKKTVLFPNPLFLSTTTFDQQQKFCKTRSPIIGRNNEKQQNQKIQTPHKFLIKSPASASKFQVRIKSPPVISRSPPKRATTPHKFLIKSPASASKFQVRIKSPPVISRSPPKRATSVSKKSPPKKMSTASKLRRSLSPSRLVNRLVSPLKSRRNASIEKSDVLISGLKQRPTSSIPLGISARNRR